MTLSSIAAALYVYTYPTSIADSFISPINLGTNLYPISFTSLPTTGLDEMKIAISSGSFKSCFVSGYFCSVLNNDIYLRPQSQSG